ncbi:hypothetical protein PoB_002577400 [Plakobranchus ocellatus]|uniref:Transmembrane protein n=1 Tax=Plakobranchus ocellatus TaxID=259542 RepID=A0AAV3ZVC3_9GAST|nr:hypothetical protein PoB_002577400 [Plakobranchus ocellatus]
MLTSWCSISLMSRWSFPISFIVWTFQIPIIVASLLRLILFLCLLSFSVLIPFVRREDSSVKQVGSPVSETDLLRRFESASSCPGDFLVKGRHSPAKFWSLAALGVSTVSGSVFFVVVFIMCGFVAKVLPGRLPLLSRGLWSPINV